MKKKLNQSQIKALSDILGVDFPDDALEVEVVEQKADDSSLSDEELESVAGGFLRLSYLSPPVTRATRFVREY